MLIREIEFKPKVCSFEIATDQRALEELFKSGVSKNTRKNRRFEIIQEYDFIIKYKPRESNFMTLIF